MAENIAPIPRGATGKVPIFENAQIDKRGSRSTLANKPWPSQQGVAEAVSYGIGLGGKTSEMEIAELDEAFNMPPTAAYWSTNIHSSSEKARRLPGWKPEHVQMLTEIAQHHPQGKPGK